MHVWSEDVCMFRILSMQNTAVEAEVIREKNSRVAGYGLKKPVCSHFYGHEKVVNWLQPKTIGKKNRKVHKQLFQNKLNNSMLKSVSIFVVNF